MFTVCSKRHNFHLQLGLLIFKENTMSQWDNAVPTETKNANLNGRMFCNVLLPLDIFMKIINYFDRKTILKCRLVCQFWKNECKAILQQEYYKKFSLSSHGLSLRYLLIRLFRDDIFDVNLLHNTCAEDDFNHWDMLHNGGDGFRIERPPFASKDVPDVPECFSNSYFVTSCLSYKQQVIRLKKNSDLAYVLKYNPIIYGSEWISVQSDCIFQYRMIIRLSRGRYAPVHLYNEQIIKGERDGNWIKVETKLREYRQGVTKIHFQHSSAEQGVLPGQDGVKMTGAVLKLVPVR